VNNTRVIYLFAFGFLELRKEKNRMKSSKWMIGLMAIALVMAFSSSSFAQVQIQLFNTPSAGEIQTNHNAQSADPTSPGAGLLVSGELIAFSTLTTTTLTLTFPAPITSSTSSSDGTNPGTGGPPAANVPLTDPITITGQTGLFASITAVATVNYAAGTISITLPGFGLGTNAVSGSFRLIGVRLDVNGKTAPLTVSANLSSSANNYINASTPVTLISSLGPGIGSFTQSALAGTTNNGTTLVFTNQTGTLNAFTNDLVGTFVIAEGFASAWRTATQSSVSGIPVPNGTNILLTIAGLPTGVSAALSQDYPSGSPGTAVINTPTAFGPGITNPTVTLTFTSTSLTVSEFLQFDLILSGTPIGALTAGSITLTATMTPNSTSAFATSGAPTASGGYPRFVVSTLGPITIGTIVAANTTMLIPYAVTSTPYDTGIAIANTTADPFGVSGGGATPSNGTITFTLYPRTATGAGSPISITTSAAKAFGAGLDTSGNLDAGGTWTGLVGGDILPAAGVAAPFFGYIFIQTNFLNAHGAAYIFNGQGFTSSTPVLVLPPPASANRNSSVESLNN
jgi:hypothetical protein